MNREGRRKRRTANQQKGTVGEDIVARTLPPEWVVRRVAPDFGLDLHVEVFDPLPDASGTAEALGEHFYIQVKTSGFSVANRRVRDRYNVAKGPLTEREEAAMIGVVSCPVDVPELLTVESMGAAVPVILCAVDQDSERTYFVCLSDYITKVLRPENPGFADQGEVTVRIPAWNVLDFDDPGARSFVRLLAKRAKLYAAFNTFHYQFRNFNLRRQAGMAFRHEENGRAVLVPDFKAMLTAFVEGSLLLDIWEPAGEAHWPPLTDVRDDLLAARSALAECEGPQLPAVTHAMQDAVTQALRRADNLGNMYEELVREWRLPTLLAMHVDDAPHLKYRPPALATEP